MSRRDGYQRQVQLLLQLMPFVAKHDCFALKGGTAINLFVRNFPRLSVDIDLVFLPMMERAEALATIRANLEALSEAIKVGVTGAEVVESFREKDDALRLTVIKDGVQIKIELSPVLRGTVFEPNVMATSEVVEEAFGYAEIQVVAVVRWKLRNLAAMSDEKHAEAYSNLRRVLGLE